MSLFPITATLSEQSCIVSKKISVNWINGLEMLPLTCHVGAVIRARICAAVYFAGMLCWLGHVCPHQSTATAAVVLLT